MQADNTEVPSVYGWDGSPGVTLGFLCVLSVQVLGLGSAGSWSHIVLFHLSSVMGLCSPGYRCLRGDHTPTWLKTATLDSPVLCCVALIRYDCAFSETPGPSAITWVSLGSPSGSSMPLWIWASSPCPSPAPLYSPLSLLVHEESQSSAVPAPGSFQVAEKTDPKQVKCRQGTL